MHKGVSKIELPYLYMNTNILDQLTFGYEIEGNFVKGLWEKLGFKGEFKYDGSVGEQDARFNELETIPMSAPSACHECIFDQEGLLVRYCLLHHARYGHEGSIAREYASEVFQTLPEVLSSIKNFNSKTYAWNATCGLHFHIGIKGAQWQKLWGTINNFSYLKQLCEEARHYCEHQKARLDSNWAERYYRFYEDRQTLANQLHNGSKYSFIRFHPEYSTLECRFMVPCEHKVQNIRKLLESVTSYLGRTEKVKSFAVASTDKKDPVHFEFTHAFTHAIENKPEVYEIKKTMHNYDPYVDTQKYRRAANLAWIAKVHGEEYLQDLLEQSVFDQEGRIMEGTHIPTMSIDTQNWDFVPTQSPRQSSRVTVINGTFMDGNRSRSLRSSGLESLIRRNE